LLGIKSLGEVLLGWLNPLSVAPPYHLELSVPGGSSSVNVSV